MSYIVGFTGQSGVGKTTQARRLHIDDGALHLSFATPLRAYVYLKYGFDLTRAGDKEYEHFPLGQWGHNIQELLVKESARVLSEVHPLTWVTLVNQLRLWYWDGQEPIVFSDVRQPHELNYVVGLGGEVVRLTRDTTARSVQPLDNLLTGYNLPTFHLVDDNTTYTPTRRVDGRHPLVLPRWSYIVSLLLRNEVYAEGYMDACDTLLHQLNIITLPRD